jgi:hypothetical protein
MERGRPHPHGRRFFFSFVVLLVVETQHNGRERRRVCLIDGVFEWSVDET